MTEQISLFNIDDPVEEQSVEPELSTGDLVRTLTVEELVDPDTETEHYFKTHGGKKGTIKEIHRGRAVSYLVDHAKGEAWVHAEEMHFIR